MWRVKVTKPSCKLHFQSTDNRKKGANLVLQTTSLTRKSLFPCLMTRNGSSAWISTVCRVRNWAEWSTSSSRVSRRCETPTQMRSRSTSKRSSLPRCVSSKDMSSPVYRKSNANLYVSALLFLLRRCCGASLGLFQYFINKQLSFLAWSVCSKSWNGLCYFLLWAGSTHLLQCFAWLFVDYLICAFPG